MDNQSPLTSSPEDSISEVFSRLPKEWTEAEMERMIAALRELRAKMGADQKPIAAKAKAPKIDPKSVNLQTLGLLK